MSAVELLEKVIEAGRARRLNLGGILVALNGATDAAIAEIEREISRPLSTAHAAVRGVLGCVPLASAARQWRALQPDTVGARGARARAERA